MVKRPTFERNDMYKEQYKDKTVVNATSERKSGTYIQQIMFQGYYCFYKTPKSVNRKYITDYNSMKVGEIVTVHESWDRSSRKISRRDYYYIVDFHTPKAKNMTKKLLNSLD